MKQIVNSWLKNIQLFNPKPALAFLLKSHCFLCATNHTQKYGLCQACIADLAWSPDKCCPQCGLNASGEICGRCLSAPPSFDITRAVFLYAYPVDTMIHRYKYGGTLSLSHAFGQLMHDKIQATTPLTPPDLIIPMPMHPTRLKERGFNQALEIAKVLHQSFGQKHGAKLDYKCVLRQTLTPPQASLPLKARVKNIKGAFKVKHPLNGKRIAIVDDVMTSGASLNELAKTLKQAGATHVECWVIARALPH